MRFVLVALGSEGDIRPFIALAMELEGAGHEVSIATFSYYFEMIQNHQIDCVQIGNFSTLSRRHFINIRFLRTIKSTLVNCPGFLEELWRVCQHAEVIIYNVVTFPCFYIAEKLKKPCFAVFMQPHHPTRAFPDPSVTEGRSMGGVFNLLEYYLFDLAHWLYIRKAINHWRRHTLQLPPIPAHETVVKQIEKRKLRVLCAYSPLITPKPKEWRTEGIEVTGYWFLDGQKKYDVPSDISDFLLSGEPPVFISAMWNIDLFTREALFQIQEALGRKLIVQDLRSEMRGMTSTPQILYIVGSVSHQWLFKRISIAVHHGGLGICMNCIRAGAPMIMLPSDMSGNDHRFWAHQVAEAGAGFRCYYNKHKFVETIIRAIKKGLRNPDMKRNATELSKKIGAENGLRNATQFILKELKLSPIQPGIKS